MKDSRLVYSTESGRICLRCGKAAAACTCGKKKISRTGRVAAFPVDGVVRIQREVKGRRGKPVTAVFGVPLEEGELAAFAKTLKRRCGAGGAVKDGVVLIQGDHRQTLLAEIQKLGYTAKIAGG